MDDSNGEELPPEEESAEDGWEHITGEDAASAGSAETAADESAEISAEDAGIDAGADNAESQPEGNTDDSGTSSGDVGESTEQSGDTEEVETLQAGETEGTNSDYVTSQQADAIYQQLVLVNTKADVIGTASVVLVVALMACLGAICVQTMLRSFEEK